MTTIDQMHAKLDEALRLLDAMAEYERETRNMISGGFIVLGLLLLLGVFMALHMLT